MKCQSLLMAATTLSTWLIFTQGAILSGQQRANAEPAPLLQPLVEEIRDRLPQGLQMRLPADLPTSDIKLYPYIESDRTGFRVNLAFQPNCSSPACTLGGFGVFTQEGSKVWPPKGDNRRSIDLGNGVRGYYLMRGPEDNRIRYVFWEQDGLKYGIGAPTFAITQDELLKAAMSMVREPAISRVLSQEFLMTNDLYHSRCFMQQFQRLLQ